MTKKPQVMAYLAEVNSLTTGFFVRYIVELLNYHSGSRNTWAAHPGPLLADDNLAPF